MMTEAMRHRGPDDEGNWVGDSDKIGLAHRRLSIIDLSHNGVQPMHYADDRYVITFNGEIYNYIELRQELKKKGMTFKTQTDTEVLLAIYAQKKQDCLKDLDGMFAFAIWDKKEQTLFCARDRFGEKPFFYYLDDNKFVFSSEIKALFAYGLKKSPDKRRIYNYLVFSAIEDVNNKHSTFYKNICQLEPAHYLLLDSKGVVKKQKYWELNIKSEISTFEEASGRFYQLFTSSINRRLRADVPVGSSLSGGLDSSSIVMLIDRMKENGQIQKTFSARFKNYVFDEGKYMNEVIESTDVEPHFVWPNSLSLIDELDRVFYHQDEPFISSSIIAQWEVMKLAKENNVTVLLDGQGADEILAGYTSYFDTYFRELYLSDRKKLNNEKKEFEQLHATEFNAGLSFKLRAKYPGLVRRLGAAKRNFLSSSNAILRSLNNDFLYEFKGEESPFMKEFNNLNEALKFSVSEIGISQLLRYADRNSMAFSREVRLPFLSHDLVEFLFSLPPDYKIFHGWTKYILRKSMEKLLPSAINWRKDKIGYRPPEKQWLSEPRAQELIKDSIQILNKNRILDQPLKGEEWKYIMIAKLLE